METLLTINPQIKSLLYYHFPRLDHSYVTRIAGKVQDLGCEEQKCYLNLQNRGGRG